MEYRRRQTRFWYNFKCPTALLLRRRNPKNCVIIIVISLAWPPAWWMDNVAKWNEMTLESTCPCLELIKNTSSTSLSFKMSHFVSFQVGIHTYLPVLFLIPLTVPDWDLHATSLLLTFYVTSHSIIIIIKFNNSRGCETTFYHTARSVLSVLLLYHQPLNLLRVLRYKKTQKTKTLAL